VSGLFLLPLRTAGAGRAVADNLYNRHLPSCHAVTLATSKFLIRISPTPDECQNACFANVSDTIQPGIFALA
jgi:hypothetical protein